MNISFLTSLLKLLILRLCPSSLAACRRIASSEDQPTQGVYHSKDAYPGQICLHFVYFWPNTGQHAPCSGTLTARRCSSQEGDSDGRMQAQRAAERGADADVASAERQLAAAQQELQAALQEQNALASVSDQVCMRASHHGLHIVPSCCALHRACRLESACSKSCRPQPMALMCAVPCRM